MKASSWAAVLPQDTTIELALARANGAGPTIERQASLPLAGDGLAAARRQLDPSAQRVVTAVSGEDVWFHVLALPTTDPKELAQMLALQLDTLTPLPIEEVVYGFESLGCTQDSTRVLVAIASKAAVNERVAALEAAGLPPELVSVEALAIFRGCQRAGCLPQDAQLNVLVQLTPTSGQLVLHSEGQPLAIRVVLLGADWQHSAQQQSLLLAELQRLLLAAQLEQARPAGTVSFVTWHEPLQPALASLRSAWRGPSELLDDRAPSPVACLGLEAAAATGPKLNLLPGEWQEKRRAAQFRRTLVKIGFGVAALYVLVLIGFLVALAFEQKRVNQLRAQVAAAKPAYTEARQLQSTLAAMKLQLDTKYSALEVLREVSRLMPAGMTLNGFGFKKDQGLTLRGQANSTSSADEFISRLEKSELFAQVKPVAVRTERNQTKFEVVCNLRSGPLAPASPVSGATRSRP